MARYKTLTVGALNLKIHPHSPELYVKLFQEVFAIGEVVKIRGADWGMPGYLLTSSMGNPLEGMSGALYRFLNINPDEPWLDVTKRAPIREEDGTPIPQIPEHLKPNLREVPFVFYPQGHRFFFDAGSFSPSSAASLLRNISKNSSIIDKFGIIDVIVESSKEAIERILSIPSLTRLEIFITRPNADDISSQKRRFLERMESQNARTFKETVTSLKEQGINPDEETRVLMDLASSNGWVRGVGYAGETKREESTDPHPLLEKERYDPNKETAFGALRRFSAFMLSRLTKN